MAAQRQTLDYKPQLLEMIGGSQNISTRLLWSNGTAGGYNNIAITAVLLKRALYLNPRIFGGSQRLSKGISEPDRSSVGYKQSKVQLPGEFDHEDRGRCP